MRAERSVFKWGQPVVDRIQSLGHQVRLRAVGIKAVGATACVCLLAACVNAMHGLLLCDLLQGIVPCWQALRASRKPCLAFVQDHSCCAVPLPAPQFPAQAELQLAASVQRLLTLTAVTGAPAA